MDCVRCSWWLKQYLMLCNISFCHTGVFGNVKRGICGSRGTCGGICPLAREAWSNGIDRIQHQDSPVIAYSEGRKH
jgi:hypothetical protein